MVVLYCPWCGNILWYAKAATGGKDSFQCDICPYQHIIDEMIFQRTVFKRRELDDVLGGPESWDNAQKTNIDCPDEKCDGKEAAFQQFQTRSADEPMTSFYQCIKCKRQWREG